MGRTTDKVITNLKDNVYFSPSRCLYHSEASCLCLRTNHDNRTYHCLYVDTASRWVPYNSSYSCDIPNHFHLVIVLEKYLGPEYVLPFVTHFRESSGITLGLFHLREGHYGSKILRPEHLAETFLTFVLILCGLQRLGVSPKLENANFIYTASHPVLVQIKSQAKTVSTQDKAWHRFLNCRKPTDVVHYLRVTHPEWFKKKSSSACVLSENVEWNDETHNMICKSRTRSLWTLLTEYKHVFPLLEERIDTVLKNRPV